jgi:hypothetical protein
MTPVDRRAPVPLLLSLISRCALPQLEGAHSKGRRLTQIFANRTYRSGYGIYMLKDGDAAALFPSPILLDYSPGALASIESACTVSFSSACKTELMVR